MKKHLLCRVCPHPGSLSFALSCALFSLIFLPSALSAQDAPRITAGELDLSSAGMPARGLSLKGEWSFYPGLFLSAGTPESALPAGVQYRAVPDQWRDREAGGSGGLGYGTYRLKVILPDGVSGLGLAVPNVATAYELEVNGAILARGGTPGTNAAAAKARYNSVVVQLPDSRKALDIRLRVSNFDYRVGGLWRSPAIGDFQAMQLAKSGGDSLTWLLCGIFAIVAFNSLALFHFRKENKAPLAFAAFNLLVALRSLVTGSYLLPALFPSLPFDTVIRLEYVTAFCTVPVAVIYFCCLFPAAIGKKATAWILAPHVPFILCIFILPLPLLTRLILVYYPLSFATMAAVIAIVVKAAIRKMDGAVPVLVGTAVILIAAVNDILYSTFLAQHTVNILPTGLAFFVILNDLLMSKRLNHAFDRVEVLLREKQTHFNEIHHRVKNSLQTVSSIVSLQANRTENPEALALFRSVRNRIRSVSLVHEKLYETSSSDTVNLGDYVRDLARELGNTFRSESADRHRGTILHLDIESLAVPMDFCADSGFIITELVTNAYKYGTIEDRQLVINLTLSASDGLVAIRITDNGPGYPDGFDPLSATSLGFRIIQSIVMKYQGEIRVSSAGADGGARPIHGAITEVELSLPTPRD